MLLPFLLTQVLSASSPERIDLLVPQPCTSDQRDAGDVVVCANRSGESPYRLKQPERQSKALPKAQLQIGKATSVAAETEEADVGGFKSNRAMVRLKIKF
jgi:hypothetical protein